jgi:hypothetical protein
VADLGPTTSRPIFLAELSRKVLVHQLQLLSHHPRLRSRLHLITLARVFILLESGLTHRPSEQIHGSFPFWVDISAPFHAYLVHSNGLYSPSVLHIDDPSTWSCWLACVLCSTASRDPWISSPALDSIMSTFPPWNSSLVCLCTSCLRSDYCMDLDG